MIYASLDWPLQELGEGSSPRVQFLSCLLTSVAPCQPGNVKNKHRVEESGFPSWREIMPWDQSIFPTHQSQAVSSSDSFLSNETLREQTCLLPHLMPRAIAYATDHSLLNSPAALRCTLHRSERKHTEEISTVAEAKHIGTSGAPASM